MEKLGQLAATGRVGPDRRRHPAVALGAGLPRRPAAHVDVPRRPDDPAAVRARAGGRAGAAQDRRGRVHAVRQGGVDDPRRADAGRRVGVRAGVRHDVRRLPGARHRHLRAAALARHRVPRGRRARAGRAARGGLLRRPALAPRRCRWPGWCSTARTRCWPTCRRARPAPRPTGCAARRSRRPCCGCTPTASTSPPARTGCSPASPARTGRCRSPGCRWCRPSATSTACARSAATSPPPPPATASTAS